MIISKKQNYIPWQSDVMDIDNYFFVVYSWYIST